MKHIFVLFFPLFSILLSQAQLSPANAAKIKAYEDTIRIYGDTMINSLIQDNRSIASYRIIKTLTKALKIENAYYYKWDSTLPWKIIQSEDGNLKIFTWYVRNDEEMYKFFGTIQMKSDTLNMFPLIDYSDFSDDQQHITVDNNNWIGCMYYGIKTVKSGKNTYYTLFGWDGNSAMSNKKVMEILWFKNGKPRFGAPIIDLGNGKLICRFILESSDDVYPTMNYFELEKRVIYDHVAPNGDALEGFYANYVPDGTYEGFTWKKGKWRHIDMIDYEKKKDGDVPNVQKKENYELYKTKTK